MTIKQLLFHEKIINLILKLDKNIKNVVPVQRLNRYELSDSWMYKKLKDLKRYGIIEIKKNGRMLFITFTEKGKKLRNYLKKVYNILEVKNG